MYKEIIKPLIDKLIALFLLMALSPLIILSAMGLAIVNKGKILFIQERPGLKKVPFKILKFKTMNDSLDNNGNLLPDKDRLTFVGRTIRKMSIDELPQLINVLKGEMSLIGPRPLLMEYLPLYSSEQATRHDVKPGITGWAQVNGRNSIDWKQRLELDLYYTRHISFQLDFKILLLTIWNIFISKGVNKSKDITMEKFKGSKNE